MNLNSFYFKILFILTLFCVFTSCTKQEAIQFQSYSVLTKDELTGIYFASPDIAYAVGGNTWLRGIICKTTDGGQNWKIDSVFDKELFCISGRESGLVIGMGIELMFHAITPTTITTHKLKHAGSFKFVRGVSVFNADLMLAVNGNGTGSIEKFSIHSDTTRTILELDHELNAIQFIDSLHWIAVGYGIVLRSVDAGEHWDTLDIRGDQFLDISKTDQGNLFFLGAGGSVYRSNDKGATFENIKSGGIISNNPPMRAICFINETKGIIAGENSSAYITRDGGSEWIQLEGLPDFDIKDIFYDGDLFWLCGSMGTIISLKI